MNPSNIHVLEYRLIDETKQYPAIYHFEELDKMQIFCRRNCDYFVLDKQVYETTSSALEEDRFVIYVKKVDDEKPFYAASSTRPLGIEVREYRENNESPEIAFFHCETHEDVFSYLDSTYHYVHGKEVERVSAEMDQDRRVYVLYVFPVGVELAK